MNWITKIIKAGEKIKSAIHKRATKEDIANSDWTSCCRGPILKKDLEENLWVCPDCNKHHRINPKQRFDILFGKNNYEIKILHNPRCSKSRETLKLLEEKGIAADVVEYLKEPLSEAELKSLFAKLGMDDVKKMMRVKEAEYKEAGLNGADVTDEQRFAAMAEYPKLLERPVVINGDKARIGRPPESVLDIL